MPTSRSTMISTAGLSCCAHRASTSALVRISPNAGELKELYRRAIRLFQARTPVVAAVQGAGIGGGLGLALSADFRVAAPSSRFAANFSQLGFHPGFGITATLPRVVGQQKALEWVLTGDRFGG